jgi:hypothetical protein
MLEKRGCRQLVYLKDRTVPAVEIPTFWRIDSTCATDSTLGHLENVKGESEATILRGKLSFCCYDVYILTTYTEREKGEKSR